MFKLTQFFVFFSLISCAHYKRVDRRAPAQVQPEVSSPSPLPGANLRALGASNTSGFGASLSLENRIRKHWDLIEGIRPEAVQSLEDRKILIALDYFFPTNFPQIKDSNFDHKTEVKRLLKRWQEENDLVLVGTLPSTEDLPPGITDYINTKKEAHNIKEIINFLQTPQNIVGLNAINQSITEFAKKHDNVNILSFENLVTIFYEDSQLGLLGARKLPKPSSLFQDLLHFNDKGQVVIYNNLISPFIAEAFNEHLTLFPMPLRNVTSREVSDVRSRTTCKSDLFKDMIECNYWVKPSNTDDFKKENVSFVVPASHSPHEQAETFTGDETREALYFIQAQQDEMKKRRMMELMGIAELIHKNRSDEGFKASLENNGQRISFDLTKALFYGLFPTFKVEGSESYENWGYDHWLSYNHLYGGKFAMESRRQRLLLNSPGVNYFIKIHIDQEDKKLIHMTWRVYATAEGQDDEQVRLDYIPTPHLQHIEENAENYPYLEYKLQFNTVDL